jgi:hypothetical protein
VARAATGYRAREHVKAAFSTFEMQRATLAVYDNLLKCEMEGTFLKMASA